MSALTSLPVFFSPHMVAESGSYSPSAEKPARVIESWRRLDIALEFRDVEPVTVEQLALAHDVGFVRDILEGRRDNGFGNRSPDVAASLLYTCGAMLGAARHARLHGGAAVAPSSGFHHAGPARVSGFCTFNGLVVAAAVLRKEGALSVGILDCDMHYGDGTEALVEALDARGWLRHFTAGAEYAQPSDAPRFFRELPTILKSFEGCEVVLYQAGADPHVDDPLGGWLTTAELRERDTMVFSGLGDLGVPVAWNLAGGYQRAPDGSIPAVLAIHDNTMLECARAFLR